MARAVQRMARRAFFQQRDETEGPIERPQQVFEIGKRARDKTCGAIRGIISRVKRSSKSSRSVTLDADLIPSAPAVEQDGIARYGP